MKRLVTFGCSLTYGQHLDNREEQCWPAQLSKMLNIEMLNVSKPGASNKEIMYNILNFDFQEDDICIILWTNPHRWIIFNEDSETSLGAWQNTKQSMAFVEHFWNEYDMGLDVLEKSSHVQLRLDKLNIPVYHTISLLNFITTIPEQSWSIANWLDIDFQTIRDSHPKANDNSHPGPEAYKEFAGILLERMK